MARPDAPRTLVDLVDFRRPEDPDTVLLETQDGRRFSYGQLLRRAAQVAHGLRSLGARPGDRVAVQMEKSPLSIVVYLACVRAGLVLLPMNPAYTPVEVGWILADADPTVFLQDATELLEAAEDAPEECDQPEIEAGDLAALLYTSGTTGRPKGVMLTHGCLTANALALHRAWSFVPSDVLLHALPVFHTHGLFVAVNTTLANGTSMVYLERFRAEAVIDLLSRCTVFMGVPTFYTRLLADPRLDQEVCGNVRLFTCGSAPLLASTHSQFRARTGHSIVERYGLTETNIVTSNPLERTRAGTVGVPLEGTDVRILDEDGNGVGEVQVRGDGLSVGYWARPELTERDFPHGGWFSTGDLGSWDANGYLVLVGRSKDLVITGGLNVHPKEVEEALDGLDGVSESAVVGLPDQDFGEAVVAAVVAETGRPLDAEDLRRQCRARLAPFKVPKRIVVVESLPRNAMGKVEKARLRSMLDSAAGPSGGSQPE